MRILDWIIVPPVLIGAMYYVVRAALGVGKSSARKSCGCSGCDGTGNYSGKSGIHASALEEERQTLKTEKSQALEDSGSYFGGSK